MSSVVPRERFVQDYFIEATKVNDPFNTPFTTEGEVFIQNSNTPTDVWSAGSNVPIQTQLLFAQAIRVNSTSPLDTEGAIGTNKVLVVGLDENFNVIQEVIVMNGILGVETKQKFMRANGLISLLSGLNQKNVGTIQAVSADTFSLQSQIFVGKSVSHNSQNTVPKGRVFILKSIEVSCFATMGNPNDRLIVRYMVKRFGTNTWYAAIETVCKGIPVKIQQGVNTLEFEKDDFRIEVESNIPNVQVFTRTYHMNVSLADTLLGTIPPETGARTFMSVY